MKDKEFLNKISIKAKTFDDGNELLNVAVHQDEITGIANADGWSKFVIARRRSPSENGKTHYAYRDDFVPKPRDGMPF